MNNEQNIEVPGRGIRCVNEKGEVGYNDPDLANNKHWQRSTGFRPKPLPEKVELPPVFSDPDPISTDAVSGSQEQVKAKPGRKPKNP